MKGPWLSLGTLFSILKLTSTTAKTEILLKATLTLSTPDRFSGLPLILPFHTTDRFSGLGI